MHGAGEGVEPPNEISDDDIKKHYVVSPEQRDPCKLVCMSEVSLLGQSAMQ